MWGGGRTRREKKWLLSILTRYVANHPSSISAEPCKEEMGQRERIIFDRCHRLQNQSAASDTEWVHKKTNSSPKDWLQSESTRKLISWIRCDESGKRRNDSCPMDWLQSQSTRKLISWIRCEESGKRRNDSCPMDWLQSQSIRTLISWVKCEESGKEKEW